MRPSTQSGFIGPGGEPGSRIACNPSADLVGRGQSRQSWSFQSVALGVAHSPRDEEHPDPSVGSSDVGGRDPGSLHLVTELHEAPDNDVQAPPYESLDVLDEDPAGSELSDDPVVLVPEARPRPLEPGPSPRK